MRLASAKAAAEKRAAPQLSSAKPLTTVPGSCGHLGLGDASFPIRESIVDTFRQDVDCTLLAAHTAWQTYADRPAEAPHIDSKDKRFKPRRLCLVGCCINEPRDSIPKNMITTALGFTRNIARSTRINRPKTKGY